MSSLPNRPRPGGPTAGPSRPLIARPQFNAPPPAPGAPYSALGSSIAGALSNLGARLPGAASGGYAPQGQPGWPAPGQPSHAGQQLPGVYNPGAYPQQAYPSYGYAPGLPPAPYNSAYGAQPPTFPPAPFAPHGFPPQYGYPSAYPPYGQPAPPAPMQTYGMGMAYGQQGEPPVASTSARTTAEGYTISAAYVPPPAGAAKPNNNNNQRQQQQPKNKPQKGQQAGEPNPSGKARGDQPPRAKPPKASGAPATQGPTILSCQLEGCAFTGRAKEVREHEEDRHLIYAPGREPKPWTGSLKPVDGAVIEGTTITLDSPEAVARWIEERKKRWPSNKVVEEKVSA